MDTMRYLETLNEILAAYANKLQPSHGSKMTELSFRLFHPSIQN